MNTTPTHPFHRDLAEKAKWPLVTRGGAAIDRVLAWDARNGKYPIIAEIAGEEGIRLWDAEGKYHTGVPSHHDLDFMLSADYSSPTVRAAVQRAQEELGMEVWQYDRDNPGGALPCKNPLWMWDEGNYCLKIHVPYSPIAPGPKKLPEDWCRELNMTVMDPDGWDRKNFETDWNIPLTLGEFNSKASRSTARHDKYIPSRFAKPSWSLSRHLSGFRALRDGEEWHQLSGWKPEMIWPGWRPKLMGEEVLPGDVSFDGAFQHTFKNACGKANETDNPTITKIPLPEPPTPHDLTTEDYAAVVGLEFQDPEGVTYRNFWEGSKRILFSIGPETTISKSHTELRLQRWLYRGHGFGWRKCEKEGK